MNAELVNALTGQKNALLVTVARATDASELGRARDYLAFVAGAWKATGYGYKVAEVRRAIKDRAGQLVRVETEELHHYRRGTRLHNVTTHGITRLEALAADVAKEGEPCRK